MNKFFAFLMGALLLGALISAVYVPVALAHAEIVSCTPAIDGTVETAPDKVVCKASQGMKAEGSKLSVFDAAGAQVDKGDSAVDLSDADRTTISVSLDTAKVVDGVYTVKWTTASADDGDEASGEFKFTVGHAMAMGTETPAATGTEPEVTHPNDDHSIGIVTIDGKEVRLKIVEPVDDASLPPGNVNVKATVEGVTLGENGYHLHFYVDEKLQRMSQGTEDSWVVAITEPGEHEIMVALGADEHTDVNNAHVHVMIEAAAAQATVAATEAATAAATETPAAEATATTAPEATATPTAELPATGGDVNYGLYALLAVFGVVVLGAGAMAVVRARR